MNNKYSLAAVAVFFVFGFLVFNQAIFHVLEADGAFNAGVAKNWLLGHGYSSSWSTVQPFEAFISSGPGFTVWQAIGIALLGDSPDVQQPWIAFIHLCLWGWVLMLLRPRFSPQQFFLLVLLSSSMFLLLQFKYWYRPAGELLSLLYLVLAFACLDRANIQSRWLYAVFGVAVALGCLTKMQFAVTLPAFALMFYMALKQQKTKSIMPVVLAAIGCLVPTLVWYAYKSHALALIAEADPEYLKFADAKAWYFFMMRGSGVSSLYKVLVGQDSLLIMISKNAVLNFNKFTQAFELFYFKTLAAVIVASAAFLFAIAVWIVPYLRWLRGLSLLLLSFWLWGLFITDYVFFNQLMIGIWLGVFFICCCLAYWIRVSWGIALLLVVWIIGLGVVFGSKFKAGCSELRYGPCLFTSSNAVKAQRQQMLDYLRHSEFDRPVLTCGWLNAHELEFSLPGVANFQECSRFFSGKVKPDVKAFIRQANLSSAYANLSESEILSRYVHRKINPFPIKQAMPVTVLEPLDFYFVADPSFRGPSKEQEIYIESWLKFCSESVFRAGLYELKKCSAEDFERYINYWGGLPFPVHEWEQNYYFRLQNLTKELRPLTEMAFP